MKPTVIVGAGISGLTIGYELSRNRHKVIIIEKEGRIGGLARSFHYNGFTFDIGPHKFYGLNQQTLRFVREVLDNKIVSFPQRSGVYLLGQYYSCPLSLRVLLQLPFGITVNSIIDLLSTRRKKSGEEDNFESYILRQYGRTLYNVFFREYTEKIFGLLPKDIHSNWAKISISKAFIDKKAMTKDLLGLLRNIIIYSNDHKELYYPLGGINVFCERLADSIRKNGGVILTNANISEITHSDNKIEMVVAAQRDIDCGNLIWTASCRTLSELLHLASGQLNFCSLIIYNFELKKRPRNNYQWCYYGAGDIIFNRVSIPTLFHRGLAPDGRGALCVEVTCLKNDDKWNNPGSLLEKIKDDLERVNLIGSKEDVDSVHIERIAEVYPVYNLDYPQQLSKTQKDLNAFQNLFTAGRTGLFYYDSMSNFIESGMEIADAFLKKNATGG